MLCPVCGQTTTGKVGTDQYYCWECCVEFLIKDAEVAVYNVEADGTLTLYGGQDTVNLEVQKG